MAINIPNNWFMLRDVCFSGNTGTSNFNVSSFEKKQLQYII